MNTRAHSARPASIPIITALLLACPAGCAPSDMPDAAYAYDDDCIELRFGGVTRDRSDGEVKMGQLVARTGDGEACGMIASIRVVVFEDRDADLVVDESEEVFSITEPPQDNLRSKNISPRTMTLAGLFGDLSFLAEIETTTGRKASVGGPVGR